MDKPNPYDAVSDSSELELPSNILQAEEVLDIIYELQASLVDDGTRQYRAEMNILSHLLAFTTACSNIDLNSEYGGYAMLSRFTSAPIVKAIIESENTLTYIEIFEKLLNVLSYSMFSECSLSHPKTKKERQALVKFIKAFRVFLEKTKISVCTSSGSCTSYTLQDLGPGGSSVGGGEDLESDCTSDGSSCTVSGPDIPETQLFGTSGTEMTELVSSTSSSSNADVDSDDGLDDGLDDWFSDNFGSSSST